VTATDLLAALPTVVLAAGAALVAIVGVVVRAGDRVVVWLGITVAAAASLAAAVVGSGDDGFGGAIRRDPASELAALVIGATTAAALILALAEDGRGSAQRSETTALVLMSAAGAALLAGAAHLLVAFIALQLMTLPLYAVHGMSRGITADRGLAQLLIGASASAAFAYGIALVYVATGSLTIGALATGDSAVYFVGVALLLAGLASAAALVPFHLWVPGAVVAAGPSTGAFIAVVTRVGAVVVLARFAGVITASGVHAMDMRVTMAVLAAATLVVANLAALRQATLIRLFAYSSVAQGGAIAVALAAGTAAGPAIAFSLVVSGASLIGACAFVSFVAPRGTDAPITALRGLARRRPLLVAALAAILLALSGLPPTAGFIAKVYVLEAAVRAQLAWLVGLTALATVVSAAAHLRLLATCFEHGEPRVERGSRVARAMLVAAAVAVVALAIVPGPLLDAVQAVRF
jgi:NADH-quinone oxidoreductase subunit N